jgi:Fe-S-cluster containining protein
MPAETRRECGQPHRKRRRWPAPMNVTARAQTMGEAKRRGLIEGRPSADPARADQLDKILACGGCTACCRNVRVEVSSSEAQGLDTILIRREDMPISTRMLRQRDNGECVYLGPKGCEIYERRPAMCRVFHCVELTQESLVAPSLSPAIRNASVLHRALAERAQVTPAELKRELKRRNGGDDLTTVRSRQIAEARRPNFLGDMTFGAGRRGDDTTK